MGLLRLFKPVNVAKNQRTHQRIYLDPTLYDALLIGQVLGPRTD